MVQKIVIGVLSVIVIGFIVKGVIGYKILTAPPEEKAAWLVDRMESTLDLTKDQMVKINKIKAEVIAKVPEVMALRRGIQDTMEAQITADSFDKEAVNKFFASKEKKITEIKSFMVDKLAEIHAILTPEQRKEAKEYIVKFHNRHMRWYR